MFFLDTNFVVIGPLFPEKVLTHLGVTAIHMGVTAIHMGVTAIHMGVTAILSMQTRCREQCFGPPTNRGST